MAPSACAAAAPALSAAPAFAAGALAVGAGEADAPSFSAAPLEQADKNSTLDSKMVEANPTLFFMASSRSIE